MFTFFKKKTANNNAITSDSSTTSLNEVNKVEVFKTKISQFEKSLDELNGMLKDKNI